MSLVNTTGESAAKLAVGPGVTVFGLLTLNDVAVIAGILCSLMIFAHTGWTWWTQYQDRKARKL
ncbi:MAG: hypothetical protein ACM3YN_08360 [Parcubacteria group bacterium]